MPPRSPRRQIVLFGAGKMGGALLAGWVKRRLITAARPAIVSEPHQREDLKRLAQGGHIRFGGLGDAAGPRLVVLAVKPQGLGALLASLKGQVLPDDCILSIIAGRTISSIASGLALPEDAIVRAMPNTPAAVLKGATAAFAGGPQANRLKAAAGPLLTAVGELVWVDREDLIDAVTALSGSGPAYVFALIEALAAAGAAVGLPPADAAHLARATIIGAGRLLEASGDEPAALRQAVTSPGGTTEAALKVLMGASGLEPLMRQTVTAAYERAKFLAKS